MIELGDVLLKYFLPVVGLFITALGLYKGWVFPADRLFEQREKMSKLANELYKISGEENLKNLSLDYGYAAITKENFLNTQQRKALLDSRNPTRDIDAYRNCISLLTIETDPLRFVWRNRRHRSKTWRGVVQTTRLILYILGCYIFFMPVTYHAFLPVFFLEKLQFLTIYDKILIATYIAVSGGGLALISLREMSRLKAATNLRDMNLPQT
ncbi:hypothetical protein AB6859_07885 [Rahnella inusitata]|uniref:hypothetical protein n=1 Tax=Rahnella inusitata TaxID=58169 RepID=UPI0039AEC151